MHASGTPTAVVARLLKTAQVGGLQKDHDSDSDDEGGGGTDDDADYATSRAAWVVRSR